MSVVVTGGSGFIGHHLRQHLTSMGQRVVSVDRRAMAGPRFGATQVQADILADDRAVRRHVSEASHVFHLAGLPGVRGGGHDIARRRYLDNVLATRKVLEWADPSAVVVIASSSSVYGGSSSPSGSRESDTLRPRGGYARSKVQMEVEAAEYLERGRSIVIARLFTVVGERQRHDMAFSRWLLHARRGEELPVFGSSRSARDFSDVRAVCPALYDLGTSGYAGVVNVGTGAPRRLSECISWIRSVTGIDVRVQMRESGPEEVERTCANVDKLQLFIGRSISTDLEDVLRRQWLECCESA